MGRPRIFFEYLRGGGHCQCATKNTEPHAVMCLQAAELTGMMRLFGLSPNISEIEVMVRVRLRTGIKVRVRGLISGAGTA